MNTKKLLEVLFCELADTIASCILKKVPQRIPFCFALKMVSITTSHRHTSECEDYQELAVEPYRSTNLIIDRAINNRSIQSFHNLARAWSVGSAVGPARFKKRDQVCRHVSKRRSCSIQANLINNILDAHALEWNSLVEHLPHHCMRFSERTKRSETRRENTDCETVRI